MLHVTLDGCGENSHKVLRGFKEVTRVMKMKPERILNKKYLQSKTYELEPSLSKLRVSVSE